MITAGEANRITELIGRKGHQPIRECSPSDFNEVAAFFAGVTFPDDLSAAEVE
jgi:hypothetical protein